MKNLILTALLLLSFSVQGFYGARQNNLFESVTTIVSAGGITALTAIVNSHHVVTGSSAQEVRLPLLTDVANGREFSVFNDSSGTTTVKDSTGAVTIATITNGQGVTIRVTNSGTGTFSTILTSDVVGGGSGDFLADGSVPMTGDFDIASNDIVSSGQFSVITNSNTNITFNTDGSVDIDGAHIIGKTSGPAFTLIMGSNPPLLAGTGNTIFGDNAGSSLTSGSNNTLIGTVAGSEITSGSGVIAIGILSASDLTIGTGVFIGQSSGESITTGLNNTIVGTLAMSASTNTGASGNTMLGFQAGRISGGSNNIFIGFSSGFNSSGSNNIYLGVNAGLNSTGTANIVLSPGTNPGTFGGLTSTTVSNEMVVGAPGFSITKVYWGRGGVSSSPKQVIHHITNAEGTDISGADGNFVIAPSIGTGTGSGGHFIVQTAPPGSTGSSLNTLLARVEISDDTDAFFLIKNSYLATEEQLVAMTADDQSVTATRSMMRVTSNNVTSTNRTMDLQNGTTDGQRLTIISDTPTNAWELQSTGNQCLTALFTSTDNAALQLIWNSTTACWHEPR